MRRGDSTSAFPSSAGESSTSHHHHRLVFLYTGDAPRSDREQIISRWWRSCWPSIQLKAKHEIKGKVLFPQVSLQSSWQNTWQSENSQRVQKLGEKKKFLVFLPKDFQTASHGRKELKWQFWKHLKENNKKNFALLTHRRVSVSNKSLGLHLISSGLCLYVRWL